MRTYIWHNPFPPFPCDADDVETAVIVTATSVGHARLRVVRALEAQARRRYRTYKALRDAYFPVVSRKTYVAQARARLQSLGWLARRPMILDGVAVIGRTDLLA